MPVCSYLVYPRPGRHEAVTEQLTNLDGCRVIPAEDRSVMILVTETPDDQADRDLRQTIETQPDIDCLALCFAHAEEDPVEANTT